MKNKKGFSLAEVLIAVTIAAIIATMGFTIAKKGIERAYNQYIYTGYYSLSAALSDAEDSLGNTIRDCVINNNLDNANTCQFTNRIINLLSGRHMNELRRAGELNFDTPNGTRYHIEPIQPITPATEANTKPTNSYLIRMIVPSVKTRRSSTKTVCMVYVENLVITPNYIENFLLPYELISNNAACSANVLNVSQNNNIQDRKDLLTFYFEDGKRGRVLLNETTNQDEYNPRIFRSTREAMCIKFREGIPARIANYLNCNGVNLNPARRTWESSNTVLKVTDPRRI